MNCPSRTDRCESHPDWNQNPALLSPDLTTRADLNGVVNLRARNGVEPDPNDGREKHEAIETLAQRLEDTSIEPMDIGPPGTRKSGFIQKARDVLVRYAHFVGPGFLVTVSLLACIHEPQRS
jgi:hypothetical protein